MDFMLVFIRNGDGEPFSWTSGYDDLSWNQLVEVENQLRFALKSVEKERAKLEKQTSSLTGEKAIGSHSVIPASELKEIPKKRSIDDSLKNTAQAIRATGPVLANWLNSQKHRKSQLKLQLKSKLWEAFKDRVRNNTNPKPMSQGKWNRSAQETMLWLIWKHVSLAHALLVLYTFPTKDLDLYRFEEITFIVEYVARNRELLYCEALETEAKGLISGKDLLPRRQALFNARCG